MRDDSLERLASSSNNGFILMSRKTLFDYVCRSRIWLWITCIHFFFGFYDSRRRRKKTATISINSVWFFYFFLPLSLHPFRSILRYFSTSLYVRLEPLDNFLNILFALFKFKAFPTRLSSREIKEHQLCRTAL